MSDCVSTRVNVMILGPEGRPTVFLPQVALHLLLLSPDCFHRLVQLSHFVREPDYQHQEVDK